jgi:hypothetical protein
MDRQTFERHLALAEGRDGVKALLSRPPGRAPLQWRVVLMLYWTARERRRPDHATGGPVLTANWAANARL